MKITSLAGLTALSIIVTSCSTPTPPAHAFHQVDNTALVIDSLDENTCLLIQPARAGEQRIDQVLTEAHKLSQHKIAVIILENYRDDRIGSEFRERTEPLYVGLRGAGYEHIVFLQGKGVSVPEGLIMLADYF
jgi:hypothetical protein